MASTATGRPWRVGELRGQPGREGPAAGERRAGVAGSGLPGPALSEDHQVLTRPVVRVPDPLGVPDRVEQFVTHPHPVQHRVVRAGDDQGVAELWQGLGRDLGLAGGAGGREVDHPGRRDAVRQRGGVRCGDEVRDLRDRGRRVEQQLRRPVEVERQLDVIAFADVRQGSRKLPGGSRYASTVRWTAMPARTRRYGVACDWLCTRDWTKSSGCAS